MSNLLHYLKKNRFTSIFVICILFFYLFFTFYLLTPNVFSTSDERIIYYQLDSIINSDKSLKSHIDEYNKKINQMWFGFEFNKYLSNKKTVPNGMTGSAINILNAFVIHKNWYFYFFPLIGLGCLIYVFLIVKLLGGGQKSILAPFLLLLNPFFIKWSVSFFNNIILLFFFLASLYYFIKYVHFFKEKELYLFSIFCGFSLLARPIFILGWLPFYILLFFYRKDFNFTLKTSIKAGIIALSIPFVNLCLLNFVNSGSFLEFGNLVPNSFSQSISPFQQTKLYFSWVPNPEAGTGIMTVIKQFPYLLRNLAFFYPLVFIVLIGIFSPQKNRVFKFINTYIIFLFFILYFFYGKSFTAHSDFISVHSSLTRYLLPVLVLLLIPGTFLLIEKFSKKIVIIIIIILLIIFIDNSILAKKRMEGEHRIYNLYNWKEESLKNVNVRKKLTKIDLDRAIIFTDTYGEKALFPLTDRVINIDKFNTLLNCDHLELIKKNFPDYDIFFLGTIFKEYTKGEKIIENLNRCATLELIMKDDQFYSLKLYKLNYLDLKKL